MKTLADPRLSRQRVMDHGEVFTPPALVNAMLDLVAAECERIDSRFLEPACGNGNFLAEVLRRKLRSVTNHSGRSLARWQCDAVVAVSSLHGIDLLADNVAECRQRLLGLVQEAHKQATREALPDAVALAVSAILARNVVQGDAISRHNAVSRDRFVPTPEGAGTGPTEVFDIGFDVIVGNPPYQINDGGGTGSSARPLYHLFIQQAMKLEPRFLTMIVPSRWFTGGKGLDAFRRQMLGDDRIRRIIDYSDSRDCFADVDIAGGVCFFLWSRDERGLCEITNIHGPHRDTAIRALDEMPVLIRHSTTLSIARKARAHGPVFLSALVSPRKPFGLDSKARPRSHGDVTLVSSAGTGPFPRAAVTAGREMIDKWKVFVSKASSDHAGQADKGGLRKVFARVMTAGPGFVCSESYLAVGPFASRREAEHTAEFLTTRTVRYLVAASLSTQNITRERFDFVPGFAMSRTWSDDDLFRALCLTETEVRHIESTIRPWGER